MTFPTNSSCDGGEGRMGLKHLIISISIHVFLYSALHLTRVSYQNAHLTISFLPFGTHDLSQANFFCLNTLCTVLPTQQPLEVTRCSQASKLLPAAVEAGPSPLLDYMCSSLHHTLQGSAQTPLSRGTFSSPPPLLSSHFLSLSRFNSSCIQLISIY